MYLLYKGTYYIIRKICIISITILLGTIIRNYDITTINRNNNNAEYNKTTTTLAVIRLASRLDV